jgi:hypothetical protein
MELTFGQSDTLLIVGSSEKEIERLLIRQSGGAAGALADDNVFAGNHGALFRDALSYGWVNIKTFVDVGTKAAKAAQKKPDRESLDGPQITPEKIMEALGVNGLRTAAISFQDGGDGVEMRLFAGIPASERRGLFKMFLPDAKDAAPPSFVPADVVTFTRYRLDLQKTFASIEALLADLNPQMAGMMKMMMEMAGKDKDPNFDLRKNLIGNMGDDIVVFQRGAKGETLEDVNNRPTVALFSSPNAEQFLGAIRTLAGMAGGNKLKEREFLGRKIYSIDLPGGGGGRRGGGGGEAGPTISLTSNGGYFVLGTDNALLEEYLRGGGAQKSLRDRPGLAEAAQKVGGMGTGLFTYENQREAIRPVWSALKKDGGSIANIFAFTPMGRKMGGDAKKTFNEWLDFSLLPDFDRIARHFNIAVYAYSANQDGIGLRMFGPNPTK